MTPEELAKTFWDSLERQRTTELGHLTGLGGEAQPFSAVHPITHKMWVQAARDVIDAIPIEEGVTHSTRNVESSGIEPIRSCCPPASRTTLKNETLRHAERCPNKCPENCNLTVGHK